MGRAIQLFGTGGFEYQFTVDGGVSQISGGPAPSEANDVLRNDDGTFTVSGLSGCAREGSCIMGDSFEVDENASISSFSISPQDPAVTTWVTVDGKPSSASEVEAAFNGDGEPDDSNGGIGGLPIDAKTAIALGLLLVAVARSQ